MKKIADYIVGNVVANFVKDAGIDKGMEAMANDIATINTKPATLAHMGLEFIKGYLRNKRMKS